MKKNWLLILVVALLAAVPAPRALKLATTTSAQSSGLYDFILPKFEAKYNVKVQVIAEGTGKAIKTARDGNADVILVHAVELEEKFVADGYGVKRVPIMRNNFMIVGPTADPAGVKKAKGAVAAFSAIKGKGVFVSRGDNSGTHVKELEIWSAAGGAPATPARIEIGQGMEQALRVADEKQAYTLTDRATYLALRQTLKLVPLSEGDPLYDNIYSVIAVSPAKWPSVNHRDAQALVDWLSGPEGQKLIAEFAIDGEHPFIPIAGK